MSTQDPNTPINEAEVAGKIGGYFGVTGSDPRISSLLSKVMPEIQLASAGDPNAWQSAFLGVMAKYEGLAKELGLGVSQTQRDLELAKNANRTNATFAAAAGRLGWDGMRHYSALFGGRGEEREGGLRTGGATSSAAYARETPLTMSGAINFAKELGVNPVHASFFEHGSAEMRDAVRDAVNHGKAIGEEKIKDMHDVSMVLGAIRAGKLKEDDPKVPESVKKVIQQMRNDGVDPVKGDSKAVKKYLDDHPKALEDVRKATNADEKATVGSATLDQSKTKGQATASNEIASAQKKQEKLGSKKPATPTVSATL